ncbi:lysosomal alpha-glucosidase-like [Amphiura filiformis]|uniref:lysosomal alpha-glucosidase-like n=1 Tax=Amphiura filiformis TaxID=82378 RepID=UPI003B21FC83
MYRLANDTQYNITQLYYQNQVQLRKKSVSMDPDVEYKVKLVTEEVHKQDFPISICRISPKGLLLIIGISLILILAVPYSGIFSNKTHKHDIISNDNDKVHDKTFDHVMGLAKFKHTERTKTSAPKCDGTKEDDRLDCYPEGNGDKTKCIQRGCCWQEVHVPSKQKKNSSRFGKNIKGGSPPSCFYPSGYPAYQMIGKPEETDLGYKVVLRRSVASPYPLDIAELKMNVYMETDNRVHFKIFDPADDRYEVPIDTPKPTDKASDPAYRIEFTHAPFGIAVVRKHDELTLFNTSIGPLIFSDQFIQISSSMVSNFTYGLGEHRSSLLLPSDWRTYTIWTQEPDGVRENQNLYGAHPFYLNMEPKTGNAHGVFLLNSNAMDVVLQPSPAITYRTIGGILDFYVFLGPTPSDVIAQYTEVIGRPIMPPYWGLGFHLCRWGYMSANNTWDMVKRMRAAGIPQDVQWNDIEYATDNKIFTYNNSTFSNLPEFVEDLHSHGQHYIQIVDPGIHNETGYSPYDTGLEKEVFITDRDGEPLVGEVWPGTTVFPDFFDDTTIDWWKESAGAYHKDIPFDGMWIDMNEPSNVWANGSVDDGCPNEEPYDKLPYMPGVYGNSLIQTSFCLSANHHNHGKHFNLHSLYGLAMTRASNHALKAIRENQRPFVITRSSFPSNGVYGGKWLGDNYSTWPDMYFSIPGILAFSMFGIPMVGADICGFNSNTNEALCQRWTQLGAFYPFSRNHNSWSCPPKGTDTPCRPQDPTAFSEAMQKSSRKVLLTRYSLLPYLYTLFYRAHVNGTTVARPLFFEFANDETTYAIDRQFLWGPALLISPVLTKRATKVQAAFPKGVWYDFYNGTRFSFTSTTEVTLQAPLDHLNLHVRAGYILPMQKPNITTTTSRLNQFELLVALAPDGSACGELFWDDGDSIDSIDKGKYTYMTFEAISSNTIKSAVTKKGFSGPKMLLGSVTVFGVLSKPQDVKVNNEPAEYTYDASNKVLRINCSTKPIHLEIPFLVKWTLPEVSTKEQPQANDVSGKSKSAPLGQDINRHAKK